MNLNYMLINIVLGALSPSHFKETQLTKLTIYTQIANKIYTIKTRKELRNKLKDHVATHLLKKVKIILKLWRVIVTPQI